jgi:4-oxalomesaconate tautomerase
MERAIRCMVMRGGTSKGLYFLDTDLPSDIPTRDAVLLAAMGSPDIRQIDGMGGADPLTSKIAVVAKPTRDDADVDYLFLQCVVDQPRIDPSQNCGNILAGVAAFAVLRGLVKPQGDITRVRIHMVNTRNVAIATIETPNGVPNFDGHARIDGVPGTSAPVLLDFLDVAGSTCGALLPTGNARDHILGIDVTCIDNGMPVVLMRASDLGISGGETPEAMEANQELRRRVEELRLAVGPLMNLGDVTKKTVPKMCLISPPLVGGAVNTRNFIPHRVHKTIGVLGAVSVATACVLPGSVAEGIAVLPKDGSLRLDVEHPTGFFTVDLEVEHEAGELKVRRSALLRTTRRLMDGFVYVPASVWP